MEKEDFLEIVVLSWAVEDGLSSARWPEAYGTFWGGEGPTCSVQEAV